MNNNQKWFRLLVLVFAYVTAEVNLIQAMEKYREIEVTGRGMWDQQFPLIPKIHIILTRIQMNYRDSLADYYENHIQEIYAQLNKLRSPRSYSHTYENECIYNFSHLQAKENLEIISALFESDLYKTTEVKQEFLQVYNLLRQLKSLAEEEIKKVDNPLL